MADGALHLGMPGMADQHDLPPLPGVAAALVVHLGDQGAGGIDHRQPALGRQGFDALRHPVGREHGHGARRHVVQLIDEDGAAGAQVFHDIAVVHDLVTDVDRRAILLECALDDFDGPFDPGAKTPRLGQDDTHHVAKVPLSCSDIARCPRPGNPSAKLSGTNHGVAINLLWGASVPVAFLQQRVGL